MVHLWESQVIEGRSVEGDQGRNRRRKRDQRVTCAFGKWKLVAQTHFV